MLWFYRAHIWSPIIRLSSSDEFLALSSCSTRRVIGDGPPAPHCTRSGRCGCGAAAAYTSNAHQLSELTRFRACPSPPPVLRAL